MAEGDVGRLQLGVRLEPLRRAEQRTLAHLVGSLAAAAALMGFAFGRRRLGRRYGELEARHRLAQEALQRNDRLAAMGELASAVAHEVRNPLNAIAMSAQRLRAELPPAIHELPESDREEIGGLVEVVASEARRLDRTVQHFLQFARPPAVTRRPTSVDVLVNAAARSLMPLAEQQGVTLEARTPPLQAHVDPDQLSQAIHNIVRNAVEATPAGGRVDVDPTPFEAGSSFASRTRGPASRRTNGSASSICISRQRDRHGPRPASRSRSSWRTGRD
jgi:signal transduction histidine kinase